MTFRDLTRGVTDTLHRVKSFEEAALARPPKIKQPDRSWTYFERLPENSVFQIDESGLSALGLFDELEEQDARLAQARVQQVLRQRTGALHEQNRPPPDLGRVQFEAGEVARVAAERAAQEFAQHFAAAQARDEDLRRMMAQVLAQGHVPQPQFGQPPPRPEVAASVSSSAPPPPPPPPAAQAARWHVPFLPRPPPPVGEAPRGSRDPPGPPPDDPAQPLGTRETTTPLLEPEREPSVYRPVKAKRVVRYQPTALVEDLTRQAAIRGLGHYTVAQAPTATIGHEDLSISGAPFLPTVPHTEFFHIADEIGPQPEPESEHEGGDEMGEDILDDTDPLQRGPGVRRRLVRQDRMDPKQRPRRHDRAKGRLMPFQGGSAASRRRVGEPPLPMMVPRTALAREDLLTGAELKEARSRRDRRTIEFLDPDAALDVLIRRHARDTAADERRAARTRRAGGFPPAYR